MEIQITAEIVAEIDQEELVVSVYIVVMRNSPCWRGTEEYFVLHGTYKKKKKSSHLLVSFPTLLVWPN